MPSAEGEGRRVVLLGGEPGSGKSRLVREFAAEAAADGALVLYGACDAVVRTPYGPFVEALDQLARATEPDELRAALGAGGGELTRLLPDLGSRVGDLPPPSRPIRTPSATGCTRRSPTCSPASAAADRRCSCSRTGTGPTPRRCCSCATSRAPAARGSCCSPPSATPRPTCRRRSRRRSPTCAATTPSACGLAGLSGDEVAEFVRRAGGEDLDPRLRELAHAIRELTDGNAFLVCELWRALEETGRRGGRRRSGSPAAGRARHPGERARGRQPAALPPRARDERPARAGRDRGRRVRARHGPARRRPRGARAARGARRGGPQRHDRGGPVARAGVPVHPRARAPRALRPAVGSAASGAAPARGRGARARLGPLGTDARRPRAPLRRRRAVRRSRARRRVQRARRAGGHRSARVRRGGGAAAHRARAGDRGPGASAGALARARHASHRGGKALDALEAFRAAAEIARELGDAQLLARAAIGYEDACWRPGIADQGAVELLEEAATALGDEDSALRVGLLGGLARALDFQGHHERGAIVRTNAVDMARRLDDRSASPPCWCAPTGRAGRPRSRRSSRCSPRPGSSARSWATPRSAPRRWPGGCRRSWRCRDLDSARREVAALLETAEQTAQPFMLHVAEHYGSAIALCDGRLDEAEARARRSHEWSRLLTGRDASGVYGIQMFSIRREQGRLAELAPVIRILAGDAAREGPWRPGLAALLAELGMEAEARRELVAARRRRARPVPRVALARLAHLPDRRRARRSATRRSPRSSTPSSSRSRGRT